MMGLSETLWELQREMKYLKEELSDLVDYMDDSAYVLKGRDGPLGDFAEVKAQAYVEIAHRVRRILTNIEQRGH